MACGGRDPNEPFKCPNIPGVVLKEGAEGEELTPDTEENVGTQTDHVFRNFVYHMYTNTSGDDSELDDHPTAPELTALTEQHPMAPITRIGRQLAIIGDDINQHYAAHFEYLISTMHLTPDTAYEAFAGVARKLFRDGNITWGRVVTLLCFGYRMAVSVIKRGIHGFFSNIVGFVCRFIVSEKIAKWIAEQGGWRAILRYVPESVGWDTIGIIFSIAALSCLAVLFLTRR